MENAFDGLISRLDPAKNPSLRRLIKTSKTENQRGKKKKKRLQNKQTRTECPRIV